MDTYTRYLETSQADIAMYEGDFRESLIKVVQSFRSFDESLDHFISAGGYTGDMSDISAKADYIKGRFISSGVPLPRSIRKWYEAHAEINRDTAFKIVFAFSLDLEETDDFFRRVYLERSFDCHSYEELIYFFCIKNRIPYSQASAAIDRVKTLHSVKHSAVDPADMRFTGAILSDISGIENLDELELYICDNIHQFEYNNATATDIIRRLWSEISGQNGLAIRESSINPADPPAPDDSDNLSKIKYSQEKLFSEFDTYLQIVGLSSGELRGLSPDGRSLSPAFDSNALIHALAAKSFPSVHGINKILHGQPVENETVRKTIIFLSFYYFWVKRALTRSRDEYPYTAAHDDLPKCVDEINSFLLNANYPELYCGNPFDWIILWASQDPYPLFTFREYISEVVSENSYSLDAAE